jgi:hypothetical protein
LTWDAGTGNELVGEATLRLLGCSGSPFARSESRAALDDGSSLPVPPLAWDRGRTVGVTLDGVVGAEAALAPHATLGGGDTGTVEPAVSGTTPSLAEGGPKETPFFFFAALGAAAAAR